MIQISEKQQQAKFVHINYPDIVIALLECNKQTLFIYNGILRTTYTFADLREDMIIGSFGDTLGNGIIRLCKSIMDGNKLSDALLASLQVKEDVECISTLD